MADQFNVNLLAALQDQLNKQFQQALAITEGMQMHCELTQLSEAELVAYFSLLSDRINAIRDLVLPCGVG